MPISKNIIALAADHLRGTPMPALTPEQMASLWAELVKAQQEIEAAEREVIRTPSNGG